MTLAGAILCVCMFSMTLPTAFLSLSKALLTLIALRFAGLGRAKHRGGADCPHSEEFHNGVDVARMTGNLRGRYVSVICKNVSEGRSLATGIYYMNYYAGGAVDT